MKKILTIFISSIIILGSILNFAGCKNDPDDPDIIEQALGWFGDDEDLENIEDDINFGDGQVPPSINLSANFPPIGDQGQYGTCVAWAVGYNHKSYMEAVGNGQTPNSNDKMFSPKYLFWKVPSSQKGADCNGTGFEPAYDVMLASGISNLATTPYTDLGDCSGSTSSWDGNAADHKIISYREVDIDITTLKQYLSQGRALSFGAKLGDNFMAYNSSDVHYSDTYGYSGQHAYHAMTLCGYDDSKGTNGAFRVVNSWGTGWGDAGYIWVDYNFFVGEFAFCAFAATNDSDPAGDDNVVDDPVAGTDLTAWEFELETNIGGDDLEYAAYYNVYNTGTEIINASERWKIFLIYYNAYDAEDWNIILYDYYSDEYGNPDNPWDGYDTDGDGIGGESTGTSDQLGNNGWYGIDGGPAESELPQGVVSGWWNNVTVQSGHSVAYDLYYPNSNSETRFKWQYNMSSMPITGDYYLVIIADGYDDIAEVDEDNNYFFFTDINGEPINFVNGVIVDDIPQYTKTRIHYGVPSIGEESISPTARTENNLNTYTRDEIIRMIKYHKETGKLGVKVEQYKNRSVNSQKSGTNN